MSNFENQSFETDCFDSLNSGKTKIIAEESNDNLPYLSIFCHVGKNQTDALKSHQTNRSKKNKHLVGIMVGGYSSYKCLDKETAEALKTFSENDYESTFNVKDDDSNVEIRNKMLSINIFKLIIHR